MAVEVTSLSELEAADVQTAQTLVETLLRDEYPQYEYRAGPIRSLVINPQGQLHAAAREMLDRQRRSSTLYNISLDPSLADDDIVDQVMETRGLTRREGGYASGEVTLVVSVLAPLTIPAGSQFLADGQLFATSAAVDIRTSEENTQSDDDKVLVSLTDGNYAANFTITAAAVGISSMLRRNTIVAPQFTLANLVQLTAAEDFSGGYDAEDNAQLLAREQAGISARALSNRVNMLATLREDSTLGGYLASSIIGYGDAEMRRDQRSIFPIAYGGRVDWYLRTAALPQSTTLVKTATLVAKAGAVGTWQFGIDRDDAPGFYRVVQIAPNTSDEFSGSYPITQFIAGKDLTPTRDQLLPDIVSAEEAAFSRYQTAVVQFTDGDVDASALSLQSTRSYKVTVEHMPDIDYAQSLMSGRKIRNRAGDALLKAPVPCYVSLGITLQGRPGATLPDPQPIISALADYINNLGFTGRLYASALSNIVHSLLPAGVYAGAIDMLGEIIYPDRTERTLRSYETLVIPGEPTRMVSARTVAFICDPQYIFISGETVNIPEPV